MYSKKSLHKGSKIKIKKEKKNKNSSESDTEGSEHELSFYLDDRVKLMKEVIKLLHPKQIKSMAPDSLKHMGIAEINSILLEELLGISNKRLKKIFSGGNVEETSSSESEEEAKPIDIISLDDISDEEDDFCMITTESDATKKNKQKKKVKEEPLDPTSKTGKNKPASTSKATAGEPTDENEKLMSVLELLELQARARAIRSQLALEAEKKKKDKESTSMEVRDEGGDSDAVIVHSPKNDEIVISSSDEERATLKKNDTTSGAKVASKNASEQITEIVGEADIQSTTLVLVTDATDRNVSVENSCTPPEIQKSPHLNDIPLPENKTNEQDSSIEEGKEKNGTEKELEEKNGTTNADTSKNDNVSKPDRVDSDIIEIAGSSSSDTEKAKAPKKLRKIKFKRGTTKIKTKTEKDKGSPKQFTNLQITISNPTSRSTLACTDKPIEKCNSDKSVENTDKPNEDITRTENKSTEPVCEKNEKIFNKSSPPISKDSSKKIEDIADGTPPSMSSKLNDLQSKVSENEARSRKINSKESTPEQETSQQEALQDKASFNKCDLKKQRNYRKSQGKSDDDTDEIIINLEHHDIIGIDNDND